MFILSGFIFSLLYFSDNSMQTAVQMSLILWNCHIYDSITCQYHLHPHSLSLLLHISVCHLPQDSVLLPLLTPAMILTSVSQSAFSCFDWITPLFLSYQSAFETSHRAWRILFVCYWKSNFCHFVLIALYCAVCIGTFCTGVFVLLPLICCHDTHMNPDESVRLIKEGRTRTVIIAFG